MRLVPEEVLVAVGIAIAVRVDLRRVARALRRPLRRRKPRVLPRHVLELGNRALLGIVAHRAVLELHLVDAVGLHAEVVVLRRAVEAPVVAADLRHRVERQAQRRPGRRSARKDRAVARQRVERQEVPFAIIVVAGVLRIQVGALGLLGADVPVLLRVEVRDAVAVDVAHVVGRVLLAREDRLDRNRLVGVAARLLLVVEVELPVVHLFRLLRRTDGAVGHVGSVLARHLRPAVEKVVVVARAAVIVAGRRVALEAVRRQRRAGVPVALAELAVVKDRRLGGRVAERPEVGLLLGLGVVPRLDELPDDVAARRALDVDVAAAETARRIVLRLRRRRRAVG